MMMCQHHSSIPEVLVAKVVDIPGPPLVKGTHIRSHACYRFLEDNQLHTEQPLQLINLA